VFLENPTSNLGTRIEGGRVKFTAENNYRSLFLEKEMNDGIYKVEVVGISVQKGFPFSLFCFFLMTFSFSVIGIASKETVPKLHNAWFSSHSCMPFVSFISIPSFVTQCFMWGNSDKSGLDTGKERVQFGVGWACWGVDCLLLHRGRATAVQGDESASRSTIRSLIDFFSFFHFLFRYMGIMDVCMTSSHFRE
jgi:hypothetical protein